MIQSKVNLISIHTFPYAPVPVVTAANELSGWLQDISGYKVPVNVGNSDDEFGMKFIIGTLSQPEILLLITQHQLPSSVRYDGYVITTFENTCMVYAHEPRGVVYACSYEIPRHTTIDSSEIVIDLDLLVEEPDDRLRAWCTWRQDSEFISVAVKRHRLNLVWLDGSVTSEVSLAKYPEYQPFIEAHVDSITRLQQQTNIAVDLAFSYGLETFIGGLNGIFTVPDYIYQGIIQEKPIMLAKGFYGGSEWAPYEWQDRPNFCPSQPATKMFYQDVVDEFITNHPGVDGICVGVGYDGYPLGCGCELCEDYDYYHRFQDQVMWVYEVVKRHHKKIWFWTWVCGCNSVIPGYDHYFGWVKDWAEANPDDVIISSFATEADFLITHKPNPVIGSRGPNDTGLVLLWPEYRGDGVVPAWLLEWMEKNLPILRQQGASGFVATDTVSSQREKDNLQGVEMYALSQMMWDNSITAAQAGLAYCQECFGASAASRIAGALLKTGEVVAKTLFLPSGVRFSGHSHIENDLRIMWDIYTLYDSAPSFLDQSQKDQITSSGPPYGPKVEAALKGLSLTNENISHILKGKDEAVQIAERIIDQVVAAEADLSPEHFEELFTRCQWLKGYAELFRGLARAFFYLKRGNPKDGVQVRRGADEMDEAMSSLPQDDLPLPFNIDAQFGGYPWMVTPPGELINALRVAGDLINWGIQNSPIGILGSEETVAALDSLYLPYTRLSKDSDFARVKVLVIGQAAMKDLDADGERMTEYIRKGGKVLLFNPSENWEAMPVRWLPGKVESWVCNHIDVTVTQLTHPVTLGYNKIRSEPISRFQATSAAVRDADRFSPFIKSFITVSNHWRSLTYPTVLAETDWDEGKLMINLLPENRTILLRSIAFLCKP